METGIYIRETLGCKHLFLPYGECVLVFIENGDVEWLKNNVGIVIGIVLMMVKWDVSIQYHQQKYCTKVWQKTVNILKSGDCDDWKRI